MWLAMLGACLNSTVPSTSNGSPAPAPATVPAAQAPGDPTGAWYVVWDRSATSWRPPTWNGEMVLSADSVALSWRETSAVYTLEHVRIDGSMFDLEFYVPPFTPPAGSSEEVRKAASVSSVYKVRGFVEGDQLFGYLRVDGAPGNSITWTPFTGKRAMLTSPPPAMAKGGPPP